MMNFKLKNLFSLAPLSSPPGAALSRKLRPFLLITLLPTVTANATTWYVDSTATSGSKNGTSWANAWTGLSSISGVKAGDVVYISGGPSGSSETYSLSGTWTPPGGSSGSPITYQIGQDSAHNGTAIFNGPSSQYAFTPANYTVISGDAGDGNMHFATSGFGGCVIPYDTGVRVAYVNFGSVGAGVDGGSSSGGPSQFEFDHNYAYINNTSADHFMFITVQDSAFDSTKIHNNTIWVPRVPASGGQFGADCFQIENSGWSLYSNSVNAYICSPTYSGGQHQDGIQTLSGSNIKIYANTFSDLANSGIFLDGYGGPFIHVYVYNNICRSTSVTMEGGGGGISAGPDGSPAVSSGLEDVVIDNNLLVDTLGLVPQGGIIVGLCPTCGSQSQPITGVMVVNNILINSGSIAPLAGSMTIQNNTVLTSAQAEADFVQYKPLSAVNNMELASSATALVGQGMNQYSYFTTDMNGNARPATGAWDQGPYMYGSSTSPSGPTLSLSPVTANASDVDPNTAGLQVYEGTTVQFSATTTATGTNTVGWQWSYTVNGGAPVFVQSGTGTIPTESFNFATGTGGNTYVWTVTASNGVTSVSSSLTMSVETLPAPNTSLTFQATSGVITAPFTVTGNYVSQATTTTTIAGDGEATYTFSITNAGNYVIQALVNAPGDSANSFYVNIDAQPVDPTMCWDIFPFTTNFQNRIVSWRGTGTDTNNQYIPKIFALTTGTHQIIFAGREANTELQSFSILELPATPQNLRILPTVSGTAPSFSAGP